MKKFVTLLCAALVFAAVLGLAVSTASATPGKTKACSSCHSVKTAVKVSVTRVSSTATTVTYKVHVYGGSGQTAWAVLWSGKNLAHRSASTGTFKIKKGRTFKVWGVMRRTGSRYVTKLAK